MSICSRCGGLKNIPLYELEDDEYICTCVEFVRAGKVKDLSEAKQIKIKRSKKINKKNRL